MQTELSVIIDETKKKVSDLCDYLKRASEVYFTFKEKEYRFDKDESLDYLFICYYDNEFKIDIVTFYLFLILNPVTNVFIFTEEGLCELVDCLNEE